MFKINLKKPCAILFALGLTFGLLPGFASKAALAAIVPAGVGDANDGVDFSTSTGLLAPFSNIYFGQTVMSKEHTNDYSKIFIGPILWNVMGEEPAKFDTSGNPLSGDNPNQIVLLSNYILSTMPFSYGATQSWVISDIRFRLNTGFMSGNDFIPGEKSAITKTINLQTKDFITSESTYTDDYFYLLSTAGSFSSDILWSSNIPSDKKLDSLYVPSTFISHTGFSYFLRTPIPSSSFSIVAIDKDGIPYNESADHASGIRPLFKLDPRSIVFASAIDSQHEDGMGTIKSNEFYDYNHYFGGKNYKLTVLGGGDTNPYQLTNLKNPITNASVTSSTVISVKQGGSFLLSGARSSSAAGGLNNKYTINYKLVDSNRKIAAYGIASTNASIKDNDIAISIPSVKIDGSAFAPDERLTAYVWLQKNNDLNSNEASQPLYFTVNVDNSSYTAPALSSVAPSSTNTTDVTATSSETGAVYLVPAATNPSVAEFENTVGTTGRKAIVSTAGDSVTVPVFGLADGDYKLYAVDETGNISTAVSITIDNVAPTLSAVTPTLTNTVDISAKSSETGNLYLVPAATTVSVSSFESTIGTTGKKTEVQTAGVSVTVPIAGLMDGDYKLYAVDEAGNISTATAISIDQTPPTVILSSMSGNRVNSDFQIAIIFSEPVYGFDVSDLVVSNGSASTLTSTDSTTYTALVTPTTDGQAVTIGIAADSVTDAAGNGNLASNTLNVAYDTTKPAVSFGGFIANQTLVVPPSAITVTVSDALYGVADSNPITAANVHSLIHMEKDNVGFSDYATSYDGTTRTFTLTFNDALGNGTYKVKVVGSVAKNVYGNTLDAVSADFIVAAPVVSGITASPASVTNTGGSVTAAIAGSNFTGQTLKVYMDGAEAATATVNNGTSATAAVAIPPNTTSGDITHILTVQLNGAAIPGLSATVTASGRPPAAPASVPANNKPVIDLNGISVDPNVIDTSKPSVTLEAKPNKDGIVYVSIPATVLTGFEGKNATFLIEIKSPYGSYRLPVNLATLIPGLKELLAAHRLNAEDINFKITLTDKSGDKDIQAAFAHGLPNGKIMGAIVDFHLDMISSKTGQTIGSANTFGKALTRMIPMPKSVTVMPSQWGAFRYNEMTKKFEFVAAKKIQIDGVWYAMIDSYSNSVYVVSGNPASFLDVQKHWSQSNVDLAAAKGLVEGVGGGLYDPEKPVTRAEFAAILVRALGRGTASGSTALYNDVKSGAWYFDEVLKAKELGLLGFANGESFKPDQPLNREEMASMLAAAIKLEKPPISGESANLSGYKDIESVDAAYLEDIRLMIGLKIMTGTDADTFSPKSVTTRAQAAVVFIRTLQALGMID